MGRKKTGHVQKGDEKTWAGMKRRIRKENDQATRANRGAPGQLAARQAMLSAEFLSGAASSSAIPDFTATAEYKAAEKMWNQQDPDFSRQQARFGGGANSMRLGRGGGSSSSAFPQPQQRLPPNHMGKKKNKKKKKNKGKKSPPRNEMRLDPNFVAPKFQKAGKKKKPAKPQTLYLKPVLFTAAHELLDLQTSVSHALRELTGKLSFDEQVGFHFQCTVHPLPPRTVRERATLGHVPPRTFYLYGPCD